MIENCIYCNVKPGMEHEKGCEQLLNEENGKILKQLRESFDFTQQQMADVLGIHSNALQKMEYGSRPIPKYIRNYASSLTFSNEKGLLKEHIKSIGVEL